MQKGKSSLGLGGLGGGAQMLFGGSGGQDIFQKISWVLGSIFMIGAMILSLMKTTEYKNFRYVTNKYIAQQTAPMPTQSENSDNNE
jgi:protein translocase SecG subunit